MSLRTRRQGAANGAKSSLWAERYFTERYFEVRTTNVYVN